MTPPLELLEQFPTNLPYLSLEQLRALHEYGEELLKADAQANLQLLRNHQTFLPRGTSPEADPNNNAPDADIARFLCGDQVDKQIRWERLYEQWSDAKKDAGLNPDKDETQWRFILNLDPELQDMDPAEIERRRIQEATLNALLDLQALREQSRGDCLIENNTSPKDEQSGFQFRGNTLSRLRAQQESDSYFEASEPIAATSTSGGQPTQNSRAIDVPLGVTGSGSASFRNPSIVSLSPEDGAPPDRLTTHFPSSSRCFHEATKMPVNTNRPSTSMSHCPPSTAHGKFDQIHTNNSMPDTMSQYLVPNATIDHQTIGLMDNNTNDMQLVTSTSEVQLLERNPRSAQMSSSRVTNNSRQGMMRKKPHVQTQRWSRSHLDQLMHKHRPRNLPESIKFTDNVDMQAIPLRKLVPQFQVVEAVNDGNTISFGASTRMEERRGSDLDYGAHGVGVTSEFSADRQNTSRTPFRLVIKDKDGNVRVDVEWTADVSGDSNSNTAVLDAQKK